MASILSRSGATIWCLVLPIVLLMAGMLFFGTVEIEPHRVWQTITMRAEADSVARLIVLEVRLPMALTALLCGMALAASGLLLQTLFANPLAGPSILGISSGASLGVAVVMLAFGGWLGAGVGYYAGVLTGAFVGALGVMALLLAFSTAVKGNTILLIFGVLVGYLSSSAISLLNFFSTQQGVHSYVIWGMGTFGNLTLERVGVFAVLVCGALASSLLFVKQLNALLLGNSYAASMGVRVRSVRNWLMSISGILAAIATAFCGPIGFLGLVMPHIARMATGSANHSVLLPATILCGGAGALLCAWLSVVCGAGQIIPVNAITPIISVPVIIYVIIKRRR